MEDKNYIFKICRVHNLKDLEKIRCNYEVNMIGIHAVYYNQKEYKRSEKKYYPIYCNYDNIDNLPIATYEIDSIRDMQKYMPDNIIPVILFQRKLSTENMIKCIELYNINKNNFFVQLHYRVDSNEITKIKNKVCKNVIATIGIFQKDFKEYFNNLQKSLDNKLDYILIDLSEHQSNLSIYDRKVNKFEKLKEIIPIIQNNKIPIILAEDTDPDTMKKYLHELKKYNISIKGIDMQNAVELEKKKQKYELLYDKNIKYQIKVRKSDELIKKWNDFFKNL